MRGLGQGLAVMVRRAMTRLVARRDILGLSVAGGSSSNLAETRVLVRLRGRAALDGGALLALGRSLRRMLHLQPGAGLPLLVIRLAEDVPDEAVPCRMHGTGCRNASPGHDESAAAGRVANRITDLCGLSASFKRKGRRSRSPPSPWSVCLSACG